jgi:hypothetical protein
MSIIVNTCINDMRANALDPQMPIKRGIKLPLVNYSLVYSVTENKYVAVLRPYHSEREALKVS